MHNGIRREVPKALCPLHVMSNDPSMHVALIQKERFITDQQATLPVGGTPEVRWGNFKVASARIEVHGHGHGHGTPRAL